MAAGEKDIAVIKRKYEDEIKTLEMEMDRMQREKDQLQQQVKNEPAVGKIAEQRRKRIQELEQSIQVIFCSRFVGQREFSSNERSSNRRKFTDLF